MKGWITLHRKIIDSSWYGNPEYMALFVHMLLRANHKPREVIIGNQTIKVGRGQFVSGRKKLSVETGVQESKVTRILKVFKSEQQIEQQSFTKFSLFSIVNYDLYQSGEHQVEQQMNNKRTTDEQQMNTNNNVNNENKKEGAAKTSNPNQLIIDRIVKHRRDIKKPANTQKKINIVLKDLATCVNRGFFDNLDQAMDRLDGTEWMTLKPEYIERDAKKSVGGNW